MDEIKKIMTEVDQRFIDDSINKAQTLKTTEDQFKRIIIPLLDHTKGELENSNLSFTFGSLEDDIYPPYLLVNITLSSTEKIFSSGRIFIRDTGETHFSVNDVDNRSIISSQENVGRNYELFFRRLYTHLRRLLTESGETLDKSAEPDRKSKIDEEQGFVESELGHYSDLNNSNNKPSARDEENKSDGKKEEEDVYQLSTDAKSAADDSNRRDDPDSIGTENPFLIMGFWEFAIISTLTVVLFPWSLLFSLVFLGMETTKFLALAMLHDAAKTFIAVISGIIGLAIILLLIIALFAGAN